MKAEVRTGICPACNRELKIPMNETHEGYVKCKCRAHWLLTGAILWKISAKEWKKWRRDEKKKRDAGLD